MLGLADAQVSPFTILEIWRKLVRVSFCKDFCAVTRDGENIQWLTGASPVTIPETTVGHNSPQWALVKSPSCPKVVNGHSVFWHAEMSFKPALSCYLLSSLNVKAIWHATLLLLLNKCKRSTFPFFWFAEGISWLLYHIILARSSSCSLDLTFPSFPFSQQMVFLILRWWTFLVIIMDLIVEMISCYTGEIAMTSCHWVQTS